MKKTASTEAAGCRIDEARDAKKEILESSSSLKSKTEITVRQRAATMPSFVRVLAFVLCVPSLGLAQIGRGYAYFAPGELRYPAGHQTMLSFGGGWKYISRSGAGLGAELGVVGPTTNFADGDAGIFSLNGYYVFKTNNKRVEPFVTGGWTRAFGHGVPGNWGTFGAGLDYWIRRRLGLMLEYRERIHRTQGVTIELWAIRFGMAFR